MKTEKDNKFDYSQALKDFNRDLDNAPNPSDMKEKSNIEGVQFSGGAPPGEVSTRRGD